MARRHARRRLCAFPEKELDSSHRAGETSGPIVRKTLCGGLIVWSIHNNIDIVGCRVLILSPRRLRIVCKGLDSLLVLWKSNRRWTRLLPWLPPVLTDCVIAIRGYSFCSFSTFGGPVSSTSNTAGGRLASPACNTARCG